MSIRLVDVELRAAIQALGRHLDRPVVFGNVNDARVTLETPVPVPRERVLSLLRSLLESYGYALAEGNGVYQVVRKEPEPTRREAGEQREQRTKQQLELFVIRLSHARADDAAATVNALYGRAFALGEPGTGSPTLSEQLRRNRIPPDERDDPDGRGRSVASGAELTDQVTIVPDPRTNSLLIRATRRDFSLIQAAVEQIDVRPLQVLIEVLIAEVRRDRSFSLGLGLDLPPTSIGSGDATIGGSTEGLSLGDLVVRVLNIAGVDLDAVLRAAASRGDVTILSRPVLLTANNEAAEILVGSQRPFVQVQRALPTDNPVRDQVIQFKDVGTKLSVRPTISADGYVMLEVTQEVNAATGEVAFEAPVISTRTVETQLLVRDGHTAVLGGLADQQREVTRSGVPVLSSIPLIGGLFGRVRRRTTATELFLFLTPRVIRDDAELETVSRETRDSSAYVGEEIRAFAGPWKTAAASGAEMAVLDDDFSADRGILPLHSEWLTDRARYRLDSVPPPGASSVSYACRGSSVARPSTPVPWTPAAASKLPPLCLPR